MSSRQKIMHPVLPGGLLSPITGADELTAAEEAAIDNMVAGVGGNETPTGTINGTNTDFTTALTPVANTLKVVLNGQIQYSTTDYTLTGTTIAFVSAPITGSTLRVWYLSTST